jgi:hypothetical protein
MTTDYADVISRQLRPSGLVAVLTARPQPTLEGPPCRCCLKPLEVAYQPHWRPGEAGYSILTCRNESCRVYRHTFSEPDYDRLDLSRYGACEHPQYRELVGKG